MTAHLHADLCATRFSEHYHLFYQNVRSATRCLLHASLVQFCLHLHHCLTLNQTCNVKRIPLSIPAKGERGRKGLGATKVTNSSRPPKRSCFQPRRLKMLFFSPWRVCESTENSELHLTCQCLVIWLLASRSPLTPSVQSITARVLLAVYVGIPHIPPSIFSPNPATHLKVYQSVQRICTELGTGTTSTLSKSLGLVIGASLYGPVNCVGDV